MAAKWVGRWRGGGRGEDLNVWVRMEKRKAIVRVMPQRLAYWVEITKKGVTMRWFSCNATLYYRGYHQVALTTFTNM